MEHLRRPNYLPLKLALEDRLGDAAPQTRAQQEPWGGYPSSASPMSDHDETVVASVVSMPAIAPGLELNFD